MTKRKVAAVVNQVTGLKSIKIADTVVEKDTLILVGDILGPTYVVKYNNGLGRIYSKYSVMFVPCIKEIGNWSTTKELTLYDHTPAFVDKMQKSNIFDKIVLKNQ